jgi:TfoX/Sxy family transcriptional regulator of competence genes
MATDQDFIDYVCGQMRAAGGVSARKMFGEYAVYLDGRVIALACDNQFFIKPVPAARAFIGEVVEKAPYPGAKLYFLIDEKLDDAQWMSALARATVADVPLPKPKKAPGAKAPARKTAKPPGKTAAKAKTAKPVKRVAKTAAKRSAKPGAQTTAKSRAKVPAKKTAPRKTAKTRK